MGLTRIQTCIFEIDNLKALVVHENEIHIYLHPDTRIHIGFSTCEVAKSVYDEFWTEWRKRYEKV